MDGVPDPNRDEPIDPNLEELLRQELAVSRDSEERTMSALALNLKTVTRTRPDAGWQPRLLAAAVMLALTLGLFALLELSKSGGNAGPGKTSTDTGAAAIGPKIKDTKGDDQPAPKETADSPLTNDDLAKLIDDIAHGNPAEQETAVRRLSHGGLLARAALEKKSANVTGAEEKQRIAGALNAFRKEEDNELQQLSAKLDHSAPDDVLYTAPDPNMKELLARNITFEFADTSFDDVLNFLTQVSGVRIALDPAIHTKGPAINLRVKDMHLSLALDWCSRLVNLEAVPHGSIVLLTTPDRARRLRQQKLTLKLGTSGDDAPWTLDETKAVCNLLPQGTVHADGAGTIAGMGDPAEFADFERALKAFGDPSLRPEGPPQWAVDTDRKLARGVTFEFADTYVEDALNFLNSLSKVNIILDPKAAANGKRTFNLKVTNMPQRDALAEICMKAGLAVVYRNQALFLTPAPAELDGSLCVFDLRPSIKAGFDLRELSELFDGIIAEAPVKNRRSALIRSRLCAYIDPWTAARINTVLEQTARPGKLPGPPPVPWFFKTLTRSKVNAATPNDPGDQSIAAPDPSGAQTLINPPGGNPAPAKKKDKKDEF